MSSAGAVFSDGEAYELVMGRWSRLVGESFLDWMDVPPGLRWADIGCGNGAFTELILARCVPSSLVGLDPSPGQIAHARSRPAAHQIDYQVADGQALPLADDGVDIAVMALVIAFIPDPAKAVAELARITRPDGWIATYMWDFEAGGLPNRHIYLAAKSLGWSLAGPPTPDAAKQEVMRHLWQAAGLHSIETETIRIRVSHPSFDRYWEIHSMPAGPAGTFIRSLSPDMRERLQARLRETLPIAADGSITFEGIANAIKGRVPA